MAGPAFPKNLPSLVRDRFDAAKQSGALTFWPTQVDILSINNIPFQLRFSPTIANKPKPDKPHNSKTLDPFLDPPKEMFIAEIPPSHFLVLNKFAIVREHFILATKDFKEQTDLLEAEDLGAAYACLKQWQIHGKELFAFFNSGQHSGASQPHRHIQLLPVSSMTEGIHDGKWKPIVDTLASNPSLELPFTFFSARLPTNATFEELFDIYVSLYSRASRATEVYNSKNGINSVNANDSKSTSISYNLGMTNKSMVLCPRRAEGAIILSHDNKSRSIGPISLNGTLLAGTLLVKNKEEWGALRQDASQLIAVLTGIGIPSTNADEKI